MYSISKEVKMTRCFVIIKDQYGNDVVHPDCVNSRLLAKIAGTKTLTPDTIKYAKRLGYVFEETPNELYL
jgi:hypothetical protein